MDWCGAIHLDPQTSETPDVETEVRRLQALKAYDLLDQPRQPAFDRIARIACSSIGVPVAILGLVDLGRFWHVARCGIPDDVPREVPRNEACCAHTILSQSDVLEVFNLSKDPRFAHCAHGCEYYAGVPLRTPDGHKVGTLCVIDTKPRTQQPLSSEQRNLLIELAAMAMDFMEARRQAQLTVQRPRLQPSMVLLQRSIAFVRTQLQSLVSTADWNDTHRSTLRSALDATRHLFSLTTGRTEDNPSNDDTAPQTPVPPTPVNIAQFVKDLEQAMESFPRQVPLVMTLDPQVPSTLLLHDLAVYRSALALLTSACERTKQGFVLLRILARPRTIADAELVVECEDTGPDVGLHQYAQLFEAPTAMQDPCEVENCISIDPASGRVQTTPPSSQSRHDVFSVHAIKDYIGRLGGDYGYRPRVSDDGDEDLCDVDSGSVFWFSVPLRVPTINGQGRTEQPVAFREDDDEMEDSVSMPNGGLFAEAFQL